MIAIWCWNVSHDATVIQSRCSFIRVEQCLLFTAGTWGLWREWHRKWKSVFPQSNPLGNCNQTIRPLLTHTGFRSSRNRISVFQFLLDLIILNRALHRLMHELTESTLITANFSHPHFHYLGTKSSHAYGEQSGVKMRQTVIYLETDLQLYILISLRKKFGFSIWRLLQLMTWNMYLVVLTQECG